MSLINDSFLLPEVRDGFYIASQVKQAWAAELEVLAAIDAVCQKHQIAYFADYGTFLGAVRHGGMIPWDDDIDICMKRADYAKFLEVAPKELPAGFQVRTYANTEDNWLFMGKVVGSNRICFEKEHLQYFHGFPYIACVDIFVLDYVHRDKTQEELRRKNCLYALAVGDQILEGTLTGSAREVQLAEIEKRTGYKMMRHKDARMQTIAIYRLIEQVFAQVPEEASDELVQMFPWQLKGTAKTYPKQFYEKSVRLPFEMMTIPVPCAYDRAMRGRYGEYWIARKDVGGHDYPFFEAQKANLQEVLDFTLNDFRVDANMLQIYQKAKSDHAEGSWKNLLTEAMEGLGTLTKTVIAYETEESEDLLMQHLAEAQQLAIDMGTLIEEVQGEGTSTVQCLERYCEQLYLIAESVGSGFSQTREISLSQLVDQIDQSLREEIIMRQEVVFVCAFAKQWIYLEPLWRREMENPNTMVRVFCPSYYYKDYDGSPKEVILEKDRFPQYVPVEDEQAFLSDLHHVNRIYTTEPFDQYQPGYSVASTFYCSNLGVRCEELIYVQPFKTDRCHSKDSKEYAVMRYYCDVPGCIYADRVIVPSWDQKDWVRICLQEMMPACEEQIWDRKIQVMPDIYEQNDEKNVEKTSGGACRKKKILLGTCIGAFYEDATLAYQKIAKQWASLEQNQSIEVIWLIDTYDDILENGQMQELLEAKRGQIEYSQGCYSKQWERLLWSCDAYYGDVQPIVRLFHNAGKPVMLSV